MKQRFTWALPDDDQKGSDDDHKREHDHHRASETSKGSYGNNLLDDDHVSIFEHHREQFEHHRSAALAVPPGLDPDEFDADCARIAQSHRVTLREAAQIVLQERTVLRSM